MRALHEPRLFAAVVFVASTIVLAVQFVNPSPVLVSAGGTETQVTELSGYFTYWDAGVIAIAAGLIGASSSYLLFGGDRSAVDGSIETANSRDNDVEPTDELLEARRREWEEVADRLANNERVVYETILGADGVLPQSEIVETTDLSKATVSRALDGLEARNLVERKRRGMGNIVLLQ